ncbi:hypothetical protein Tco_1244329 [Tanacetum coccineum]
MGYLPQLSVIVMEDSLQISGDHFRKLWVQILAFEHCVSSENCTAKMRRRTIQTLKDMLRACVIDFSKGWVKHLPLAYVLGPEVRECPTDWSELIKKTQKRSSLIKQSMQAAQDRQKSYADRKRKPMEFEVGDRVILKVSPWKGVVRFGKRGKLNPRYVRTFQGGCKVGKSCLQAGNFLKSLTEFTQTFMSCMKSDGNVTLTRPLSCRVRRILVDNKSSLWKGVEIMEREIKRFGSEFVVGYHWSRFAGTLGGALSSPGNVKIRSNKNTHIFSQTGLRHLL